MSKSSKQHEEESQAEEIRQIIDDCVRRRAAGEGIDADHLVAAHQDLMPELGRELERMRKIGDARQKALQEPSDLSDEMTSGLGSASEPPPSGLKIEGYKIVRELQRGGQGVIYQAVQKATKRKVAIKVLLEGPYASESAQKRFEREIELIAQLKHPNIISIFHSGTTTDGRQFYVMDYVRGVSISQYVAEEKPTLEEALQLFRTICEAVQFAHQRGIMHRDLKPSNILVDLQGNPKLLDFGLAKWITGPVETIVSVSRSLLGTLAYMSPEQTRGNPDEIDTRTDVYSLGVILYEMLTGHYPYPVAGEMADVLRNITETPPTPPSRTWTTESGVTKRSSKHLRPGRCPIDGDLETVILKTLSKNPQRRYQSAGELARDIDHYLSSEPIEAKRDSLWYILRKKASRYRTHAVAASIAILILVVGWFGHRAWRISQAEALVAQGIEFMMPGGDIVRAYAKFDEARMLDPGSYRALANQALIMKEEYFSRPLAQRDRDQLEIADDLCNLALSINPDSPGIWNLRAVILYSLDRLSEAEAACRYAFRGDPNYHWALTNLAKILALQGRFAEAIDAAGEGVQINAKKPSRDQYDDGIWRVLGTLQLRLGQPEAEKTLREAESIDERDNRNGLMLARLYLTSPEKRDYVKALEKARHAAVSTGLKDPRFKRILAQAYLRNEAFSDAAEYARAAIADGDTRAYGELIAAVAEARLGNRQEAEEHFKQAKNNWPGQFTDGDLIVTAEKGLLWFDTLAELKSLQSEAEKLLAEQ